MSTNATTASNPPNPFTPYATAVNTSSPSQSNRPVTLPHISELYLPLEQALDTLLPPALTPSATPTPALTPANPAGGVFMDALRTVANRTTTWNDAPAYKSTLSPTLDAFASLSQASHGEEIAPLLDRSWAADPAVTLRIIWNLRSIHEGKSAREDFYRAFAWLYIHHPRTAIANLRHLVEHTVKRTIKRKAPKADEDEEDGVLVNKDPESEDAGTSQEREIGMSHGYWKDLLNILLLATLDQLTPTTTLSALHIRVPVKAARGPAARARDTNAEQAKALRRDKHRNWHATVVHKLAHDKPYRALYVTVVRLFVDGLSRDLKILREIADPQTSQGRRIELAYSLSLVGKWAPSIGGSHDRVTSVATPIAELLNAGGHLHFPVDELAQPLTQETAHRLRSMYARWVTGPLRRVLCIPEIAMSAGKWDEVQYRRVASHCMRANKKHFLRHDNDRFSTYLRAVAQGKASISGATLLPHELLYDGLAQSRNGNVAELQVTEAQWAALVDRVREAGALPNGLAVCDVSGSMGTLNRYKPSKGSKPEPIGPAVALSILLAQIARPPWANTFITFSEYPELVALDPGAGLVKTTQHMVRTKWGYNTDFNAVFTKLILPMAIEHKLRPEDMVQRLFVFSDMQFDNSGIPGSEPWASEHQKIKREFEKAGYAMPEMVYWNLNSAVAKPVTKDEEGVALVSGFSPGMLKVFLDGGLDVGDETVKSKEGEDAEYEEVVKEDQKRLDPVDTMLKALGKQSFAGLEVFD